MTDPAQPPAPSAEWSAPDAAPAGTPRRGGVTVTLLPGQLLALAGGVLVLISGWIDWIRGSDARLGIPYGLSAYDIPARFLLRDSGLSFGTGGPALGVFVFVLAIICLVAALARPVGFLALPGGLGALALAVWFALRLRHFLEPGGEFFPSFRETLGPGVIMLGIGGALAIAGGIVSLTNRR